MSWWVLLLTLVASAAALMHAGDVSWAALEGSADGLVSAIEVAAGRLLDGDPGGALRALATVA